MSNRRTTGEEFAPVELSLAHVDPLANRTEQAASVIRRAILTGRLRPGQPLVESDIAASLGMSKTPIREALKTLVGSGLVVLSAYRGASVRAMDSAAAAAVYDMRLLLEPEGVRRAVRNGGDLGAARRSLDLAAEAGRAGDTAEMSLHNREFHQALYMACGNPILVRTLDDLRDQAALVSVSGWRSAGGPCDEAEEHEDILAAAQAGDANRAAQLLAAHISGFIQRVLPALDGHVDPAPAAERSH
ncbi:GntR family transcriptional regulator [Streptomyces olivaceus]|uniref:GntR family transcriptional regulator n=1 Tax=unclassified Streptomyces TaxID=2593676 RepID=UPI000B33020E|nr:MULTISPECIES: GntR family transcriptional regulator [Streptomyces]MCC2265133.1 GntR family transcriptional regulator [Streptomyces sp. CT1-17]MCU8594558.1 GntR family transcriptional regulator [Streptomyces sp. A13(2022)]QIP72316.1 GntR family transcriptional regulator [Streptomyces sp. VN1]UOG78588.1 GntR family transcriptional regulator [Streptomyces sp. CB09030]GHI92368.1 transcriptional regulator [Streptomyces olivaceus]